MEHAHPASAGQNIGTFANVDGILWDMSSKLARAQIARQMSNHSALRRQQQSRVHKPLSTGNSPQTMSRRRMGIQQRFTPYQSELYPPHHRRRAITTATNNPVEESKPSAWHPQFMSGHLDTLYRHTMYEAPQHMLPPYPLTATATTSPASQAEHSLGHRDRYYSVPTQNYLDASYMHVPISSDWATDLSPVQPSLDTPASAMPSISHGNNFTKDTQRFSQDLASLTPPSYMQPRYPYSAPITPETHQRAPSKATNIQDQSKEEDDGPELIGMGLYDPPEPPTLLLGGENTGSPSQNGRALKLADAWTPPDEDDEESDDGEGEDEDSEQHEDEMETDIDDHAVPSVYGSGNHLPQYDLSNKSFYFVEDSDAAVGAAALAGLTVADWNGCAQSWAS